MRRLAFPLLLSLLGVFLGFVLVWKGGKSLEATWLLAAFAFAATLLAAAVPLEKRKDAPGLVPVLLLCGLAVSLLSFRYSVAKNYGLDELLRDASLAAVFCALLPLVAHAKLHEAVLARVAGVTVWATLAATVVGFAVYALQPVNRFVGTFFDYRFHTDYWPNAWAELVLLAWPLTLLAPKAKGPAPAVRPLLLGSLWGAVLLSYSRGAFLVLLAQCLLLAVAALAAGRKPFSGRAFSAAVLSVAAASIAVGLFFSANGARSVFHEVESVAAKVTFTAAEGTSSIDERSSFWKSAWAMLRERPLFGFGPYSFRFVQPAMQEGILATSDHPHNAYLKLGAERGAFALALALAATAVTAGAFGLAALQRRLSWNDWALACAAGGVLLHNMIDYNLQFVGIALPLTAVLALLVARTSRALPLPRHALQAPACAVAALCLAIVLRETPPLLASSAGRHAEVRGDYPAAVAHYARAADQLFPRDLYLSLAASQIASHDLVGAQQTLVLYRRQNAVDARQFSLGGFLRLSLRNPEAALGDFSQAFKRGGKNDASILRGIALVLRDLRRPELTREWEQPLFASFEAYVDAVGANAHFIALSRNVEELSQAMAIAEQVYPERKPELRALAARLDREAMEERRRLSSRPRGLLW